jgi:hypothetical protein
MIITISREYATNGVLIARKVAEGLRIPIFERELINQMAHALDVQPEAIDHIFEHPGGGVQSVITEWLTSLSPEKYLRYLKKSLAAIAARGDAVVCGRGANFVLRGQDDLHVRIIAPLELRMAIFHAGNDLPEAKIRRIITARDRERAHYVRNVFHQQIDDPHHYDLVLNLARITPEEAVAQIILAVRARVADRVPAGVQATMPEHLRLMIAAHHHVRPELVEHVRAGERR